MRRCVPDLRTEPSRMCATLSSFATCESLISLPLYENAELRDVTCRSGTLASRLSSSSDRPSEKYSWSFAWLMSTNGITAMDLASAVLAGAGASGAFATGAAGGGTAGATGSGLADGRRKTKASSATTATPRPTVTTGNFDLVGVDDEPAGPGAPGREPVSPVRPGFSSRFTCS